MFGTNAIPNYSQVFLSPSAAPWAKWTHSNVLLWVAGLGKERFVWPVTRTHTSWTMTLLFLLLILYYSEKAWACDLNGITQRTGLADGYIITSAKREWLYIHTPIPELSNAIQITGQMPSPFYIIPLHDNLSNNISLNVTFIFTACCWLCATVVALVFWIGCKRGGCTCCHLWKTS